MNCISNRIWNQLWNIDKHEKYRKKFFSKNQRVDIIWQFPWLRPFSAEWYDRLTPLRIHSGHTNATAPAYDLTHISRSIRENIEDQLKIVAYIYSGKTNATAAAYALTHNSASKRHLFVVRIKKAFIIDQSRLSVFIQ